MDQEQEKRLEKFGSFVDETFGSNLTTEMRKTMFSIARFIDTNMIKPEDIQELKEQKKLSWIFFSVLYRSSQHKKMNHQWCKKLYRK